MKGRIVNLTCSLNGEYQLTIQTRDKSVLQMWDDLHESDVTADIKRWRPRKTRDQNAYAWKLIDMIAEKTGYSKRDVYREAIRGIGGVSDTCCVADKAVKQLVRGWEHHGLGWFAEATPSKLKGCTNVILYYGSSTYDTKQMSALIDHLKQDAQSVGIDSMTPMARAGLEGMI